MTNNRGNSPSCFLQLTYCTLNENRFQPQARFKPEAVVKIFALMVRSHICGDGREKWWQVLSLFFASSRQRADPTKEPLPSPQGPSYGGYGNSNDLGSDLCHITWNSCLQQGENGKAGSDPICRPPHHSASQGASSLASLGIRLSLRGRQSLSLLFYFYFQCIPEDEQNVQLTPCDHRAIYKLGFWDTHAS